MGCLFNTFAILFLGLIITSFIGAIFLTPFLFFFNGHLIYLVLGGPIIQMMYILRMMISLRLRLRSYWSVLGFAGLGYALFLIYHTFFNPILTEHEGSKALSHSGIWNLIYTFVTPQFLFIALFIATLFQKRSNHEA